MTALRIALYAARSGVASLRAYRLRTILTALGVMIGVSTVVAILAIINGLNTAFHEQVALMGTGTLYVNRQPMIALGDWWRYAKRRNVTLKDAAYLDERLGNAKAVVPFADFHADVVVGHSVLRRVRVIGTTSTWPMMSGVEPDLGRFFAASDVGSAHPVVVAGAEIAQAMKHESIAPMDRIVVAGHPLQVLGTLPVRGQIFGKSQDDFVVIPLPLFERYFGTGHSISIGVVFDPDALDAGTDEITAALRTHRKLGPGKEDDFSIEQQEMFVELYHELTRALFATAIGLGLVTLIAGGVGIMNIMLVSVTQRTREIGIRKALGARPGTILLQFVIEAGVVSGTGGVFGTVFGLGLAKAVASVTPLPVAVAPSALFGGLAFGLFVGVTFGFLPACRASRLVPVRALDWRS